MLTERRTGIGTYVEEGIVDNPEEDNILEEGIPRTPAEAVGVSNSLVGEAAYSRFCSSRHQLEQPFSN